MNSRINGRVPLGLDKLHSASAATEVGSVEISGRVLKIMVRSARVDEDGTFETGSGNLLFLISFLGGIPESREALDLAIEVIPDLERPAYIYYPKRGADGVVQVGIFRSSEGAPSFAPGDFDWWKHSYGEPKFSILQILDDRDDYVTVYESLDVAIYLPYIDGRGRYFDDVMVLYPDNGSEYWDSFSALLGGLSRKGAIDAEVQLLSFKWSGDGAVDIILKRARSGKCYLVSWMIPTLEQMDNGGFFVPGGLMDIRSSAQLAGSTIARLKEFGSDFGGRECECPHQ